MGQPVKVSDALLLDARLVGGYAERSIARQIEFWAKLGRALEPLLHGDQVFALCKAGGLKPLSISLQSVDSPAGRRRLARHLRNLPSPHYEPIPGSRGLLMRTDANGRRTAGRFVHRQFREVKTATR